MSVTNSAGDTTIHNANGCVTSPTSAARSTSRPLRHRARHDVNKSLALRNENGSVDVTDVNGKPTNLRPRSHGDVSKIRGRSTSATKRQRDRERDRPHVDPATRFPPSTPPPSAATSPLPPRTRASRRRRKGQCARARPRSRRPPPRRDGTARVTIKTATSPSADIRGAIDVDTTFATVRAERIHGDADVQNQNGSVSLTAIDGGAKVRTGFGSVFLKDVDGPITVDNQNGAIGVAELPPGKCRDISLKTSFSSIRVALRSGTGYNVHARTSFGSIHTDLPITTSGTVSTKESITGTINGGGLQAGARDDERERDDRVRIVIGTGPSPFFAGRVPLPFRHASCAWPRGTRGRAAGIAACSSRSGCSRSSRVS